MKKLAIILAVLITLLAGTLAMTWWWLTDTRSGAEWALNRAGGAIDTLQWESIDGGLASGLVLKRVEFGQAGTRASIAHLEIAARIRLIGGVRVEIERLHLREVELDLPEAETPPDPVEPFDPGILASPVPIDIGQLLIEQLRVTRAGIEPIEIDRLAVSGHYGDHLRLDSLELLAPRGRLHADGRWALRDPYAVDMRLTAGIMIDGDTEQEAQLSVSGPLSSLEVEFHSRGPANLEGSTRLRGLPRAPSAQVRIAGSFSDWPGAEWTLEALELHAEGTPEQWSATMSAHVAGMDLPPGRWWLSARGDGTVIDVDELRGEILDGEVIADGQFDYGAEEFTADVGIRLDRLDLTRLYPEWPEQARLGGEMTGRVRGDEIHLDRLDIGAPPTSLRLTGSGRFLPTEDELALDLDWRDFTWPPVTDDTRPMIASESGSMRVSGRISDWRLELEGLLDADQFPAGHLQLSADGDAGSARIEAASLQMAQAGAVRLHGTLAWDPALAADVAVAFDDFDPGTFVTQLPGRINAAIELDARHERRWLIDLGVSELAGQIRGQPLSGGGRLVWTGQHPESGRMEIGLGENRIEMDSRDGEHWQWQLDARAMEQLWPELAGSATLNGSVQPFEQRLDASGEIRNASYEGRSLQQALVEAELDWGERPDARARLHLVDLDLNPWERIDQLELAFGGDCDEHRLELDLSGRRGSVELAGSGRLDGCLRQAENWQVTIERFDLAETIAGDWQLADSLPISLSGEGIETGRGCLRAVGEEHARLCLESLSIRETGTARLGIEQVPMDLVLLMLDPVYTLATPLSGQLEATWTGEGLSRLDGYLALDSGALRPLDGERDLLAIESVRLDFTPQADQGLLVDLLARLEGDSEVRGQAEIVDLRDPASARIDAEARMNLPDIGAFNHLVTELDQLGGRLNGTLSARGALLAPEIEGRLSLSEGYLAHAPLGLKVADIGIDLEGATDRASLSGRMRSGEGSASIDGVLTLTEQAWDMELDIAGERFAFADVEWLRLTASPAIRIEGRPDQLTIDGDIHIDRLRAGLPPGTGERISPSPDIRVVGEEEPDDTIEAPLRRLHGRLGIHLGEDARMAAAGLQTRLAGGVELLWNGDPTPRGRGVIRLTEGSYRAYGQNLAIRDGEVIFTGHAIDDPRLNIRAVRDIFGDPRVEDAGVHIRGSARNPEITLFTDPPTSEEKALAYVVTGADFDHAAGQGAVNIGFYLIPRVFVSYGIGLFEAGNVLLGRYELSERWGVRVVSGERDTGVDLSFMIDR